MSAIRSRTGLSTALLAMLCASSLSEAAAVHTPTQAAFAVQPRLVPVPFQALQYSTRMGAMRLGRVSAAPALGLQMQQSNRFEIEGTLVKIKDPQSFPSGFVKREFVVRTDEMYPQEVMFELFKDKISLIESYQVNEQIKVSFNIRGREWEGKHFTNLQAWRVERVSGDKQLADQAEALDLSEWEGYGSSNMTPKASAPPPAASPARKSPAPAKAQVQWDDDIPF